jgi:hypothetical protein
MRSTSRLDAFSAPSACQSSQATARIDGVRVTKTPNRNSRIAASEAQSIPSKELLIANLVRFGADMRRNYFGAVENTFALQSLAGGIRARRAHPMRRNRVAVLKITTSEIRVSPGCRGHEMDPAWETAQSREMGHRSRLANNRGCHVDVLIPSSS